MNSKLIVVGTISAAVGAVVSWAVTADFYDRKVQELDETYEKLLRLAEDEVHELKNRPTVINQFVDAPGLESEDIYRNTQQILEKAKIDSPEKTSAEKIAELQEQHPEPVELVYDQTDADEGQMDEHGIRPVTQPDGTDEVEIVVPIEEVNGEDAIPPGETEAETRSNLQSLIDQYTHNEEAQEAFVEAAIDPPSQNDAAPYVIPQETFAWDEEGDNYHKATLKYFPNQRLLIDEDEDPIDDVAHMVGWRNLQRFGDESGDADTVFIRNRKLQSDFEVVRELDESPPLHVTYGMDRETFATRKAAGLIKVRPEDQ